MLVELVKHCHGAADCILLYACFFSLASFLIDAVVHFRSN
jgi:hypothetical protein